MKTITAVLFIVSGILLSACGQVADDCGGAGATFGLGADSGRTNFVLLDDCGETQGQNQSEPCNAIDPTAPDACN